MARNSSTHFAYVLAGSESAISNAFRQQPLSQMPRGMYMSTGASNRVGLPTLGNTGMKFNSSRWTNSGAEEGLSIFDTKGAMDAIQHGPDEAATKRAHPAALAHAARVARAQQVGITFYGFKVFPDLTPGRAFMWGTVFAVYAVGMASFVTARALDIQSVGDVKEKMQEAFAPYKEAMRSTAGAARTRIESQDAPEAMSGTFESLQTFGQTLRRALN